jgi:tellurite resistance protein
MNASEAEELLQKYYDGETSLEEERRLREYFRAGESVPAHLRGYAAQFGYAETVKDQQAGKVAWEEWLATYDRSQKKKSAVQRWLGSPVGWQVAASVLLLLLGFGGGVIYDSLREKEGGLITEAPASRPQVVATSMLQFDRAGQTSASERIQAIRQSTSLDKADRELIQALTNTLNFDDNVNVRLAAFEALYHFADAPDVREAFIRSLGVQTDPAIQIALIDALIALREKRALQEMQRLTEDKQTLEVVRLRAQQGVGQLI